MNGWKKFVVDSYLERSWTRISILVLCMTNLFLAAAVFLAPGSIQISPDGGSLVDWIAAVGTWVIGIGAIRFAASDHALKISERQERRLVELNSDLEIIQSVARAANGARAELKTVVQGIRKDLANSIIGGMRNSVALSQLHGAMYVLSWNQAQLRLLSKRNAALAESLDGQSRQIKLVADRLAAGHDANALFEAVQGLIDSIQRLQSGLAELASAAATDAAPIERGIRRLTGGLSSPITVHPHPLPQAPE